jgi:hypothetical protein
VDRRAHASTRDSVCTEDLNQWSLNWQEFAEVAG